MLKQSINKNMKNYGEVREDQDLTRKTYATSSHKESEELLPESPFSTIRWCKKAMESKVFFSACI